MVFVLLAETAYCVCSCYGRMVIMFVPVVRKCLY